MAWPRIIRLATAITVLPLEDPIRLAEDVSVVDTLSGGRVEIGVGSGGSPIEYAAFGKDVARKRELTSEALVILRDALANREVGTSGFSLQPRPKDFSDRTLAACSAPAPGWVLDAPLDAGARVMSVFMIVTLIAAASAMTMIGPRVYSAMARDGYLPKLFAAKDDGRPPVWSVLLQGAIALAVAMTTDFIHAIQTVGTILTLMAGLTVPIAPPEIEARLTILERVARQRQLHLPKSAAQTLAWIMNSSMSWCPKWRCLGLMSRVSPSWPSTMPASFICSR